MSFFVGWSVALGAWSLVLAEVLSAGDWRGSLIGGIAALLASALAYGVVAVGRGIAKKAGFELKKSHERWVHEIAQKAILWVAEKAAQKAKLKEKMPSGRKLELAAMKLVEKVPGISMTEAREIVETNLADLGEGAASSFRALSEAAATLE